MPRRAATIASQPTALEVVDQMPADGLDGSVVRDRRRYSDRPMMYFMISLVPA